MDKQTIMDLAKQFVDSDENVLPSGIELEPQLAGMRYFSRPLIGFGSAADKEFEHLRDPAVVGPHFRKPLEWLAGAKTVISVFLPHTKTVSYSNRADPIYPSPDWLHARIEGQAMINRLAGYLVDQLTKAGYGAVYPSGHAEFRSGIDLNVSRTHSSNWSERHVAYVCGLGTFGIAAGLITEKGTSGRFCSVVTTLELPPDPRPYADPFAYCNRCGACVRHCFVNALSMDKAKDKAICSAIVDQRKREYSPRYGCGKCHVGVPCERGIPGRKTNAAHQ